MKRALSLFLALLMALSVLSVTALAADGPSITATVDKTEAAIGDTVEATFALADNPGYTNIELTLTFDHEVLKFTGLKTDEDGDFVGRFGKGITEFNANAASDQYGFITNVLTNTYSNNADLFVAQFEVIGAGSTAVGADVTLFQNVDNSGSATDYTATVTPAEELTVAGTPATSVTLNQTSATLEYPATVLLRATVEPSDTTDTLVWTSSDESVATVSQTGQVSSVAPGTAVITARANDDAYAECTVTVKAEQAVVGYRKSQYGNPERYPELTNIRSMLFKGETKTLRNLYKFELVGHESFYMNGPSGWSSKMYALDGTQILGGGWGTDISTVNVNQTNGNVISTRDLLTTYADLQAALGDDMEKLGVTETDVLAFTFVHYDTYEFGILFVLEPVETTSITIDESAAMLAGKTVTLTATLAPQDTTGVPVWTSSDESVATVDAKGVVTGVGKGTATITATIGELSDTCAVSVFADPVSIGAPSNGQYGYHVSDIQVAGVTVQSYVWNDKTATVYIDEENAPALIVYKSMRDESPLADVTEPCTIENYQGSVSHQFVFDGWIDAGTFTVNFEKAVAATSLALDKETMEVLANSSDTITATLSEGSTDTVTWTSADESIATVDANGKVTGVKEGTVTITASVRDLTATCEVTVKEIHATGVTFTVNGEPVESIRIRRSESVTVTAVTEPATITDPMSWTSGDTSIVVAVRNFNHPEQVNAATQQSGSAGTTTLTFTAGDFTAELPVEVYLVPAESVTLSETELNLNYGDSVRLTATVEPSNTTDRGVWSSSDTNVVTVANNGTVNVVNGGTATITYTIGDVSAECAVTVAEPYIVTEGFPPLSGRVGTPTFNGIYITGAEVDHHYWDEDDPNTLHVILAEGVEDGTVVNAIASVNVPYIAAGPFKAGATLENGAATANLTGSGTFLNQFTVTVDYAVSVPATSLELDKESIDLLTNKAETITATLNEGSTDVVTWTSSDETVATVNSKGEVTGVGDGTAVITASVRELSATCQVTVTTVHASTLTIESENIVDGVLRIRKTDTATATYVLEPAEISDPVVWSIEEAGGATVSQDGVITSKDYGTGTLTVTAGELTASVPVEVYRVPAESVTFRETEATALFYDTITLYIDVLPENTTDTVTWSMENSDLGNFNGRYADHAGYYAYGVGTNVITATVGDVSDTCTVTVNDIIEPEDGLPAPIDSPNYDDVVMDRCGVATAAEVAEIKWDEETPDLLHVVRAAGTEDGTRVKGMGRIFVQSYSANGWSSWYNTSATLENGAASFTVRLYNRGLQFDKTVTFDITVEESTEPVTATVDILSQMSGGYLHAPAFGEEVNSRLAESYGYFDEVDGVSALDVLVRAHELTFGEEFTADTAEDYLVIAENTVKKQFGVEPVEGDWMDTFMGSFTVNDIFPNDNGSGYTITQAEVKDGDKVEFMFGENEYTADLLDWFLDENEEYTGDKFTVPAGEDLTIFLRGVYLYLLTNYSSFDEVVAEYSDNESMISNCEDIQLYTVDLETGALTEIEDAITDIDGEVTLSFAEPGTYTIVAYGADEDGMYNHVMRMATVEVTASETEPAAQVVSASLTLAGDIGVNYYVIPNEALLADEVAYAQFTVKGVEGEPIMLASLTPDADGRYCFTQYVAAKEMVEQITLKLYTGEDAEVALTSASGAALENGAVYSVAKYVKSVSDATKPLAEKLASFGAYAQTYFAYEPVAPDEANADAIVGQDVSGVSVDDLSAYATTKDGAVTGVTVSPVSLTLDSLTTLNVVFTGKAVANCTVTVNGATVKPVKSGSKYRVHIPNIAAKDLDEAYTIVVQNGDETLTLTASALSFARNTLRAYDGNEAKVDLCNLVRALYEYSVEANEYFGA